MVNVVQGRFRARGVQIRHVKRGLGKRVRQQSNAFWGKVRRNAGERGGVDVLEEWRACGVRRRKRVRQRPERLRAAPLQPRHRVCDGPEEALLIPDSRLLHREGTSEMREIDVGHFQDAVHNRPSSHGFKKAAPSPAVQNHRKRVGRHREVLGAKVLDQLHRALLDGVEELRVLKTFGLCPALVVFVVVFLRRPRGEGRIPLLRRRAPADCEAQRERRELSLAKV
mmetsp:Transcript_23907/g.80636  ORF Transcript_23907/g.80636 Transcript_23907/m.80636 type:complete len:225 (-) Transcript_23907:993-1667(-)